MRVFPGDGITAPRLALLKSYSSRMVLVCLATTVLASGNQARPLVALGVNDHKHPAQGIHTQSDKSLLTLRIGVFDSEGHRIEKRLLGMSKADPVLAKVRPCFDRIEFNGHRSLCIFYAYVQLTGLRLL